MASSSPLVSRPIRGAELEAQAALAANTSLGPITTLPPETLGEIFIHSRNESLKAPNPKSCPLLLTRVCRRWRTVALSTPALWGLLFLDLNTMLENAALVELHDEWLSRARCTPLIVILRDASRVWEVSDSIESLVQKILRSSHLWEHVEFTVDLTLAGLLLPTGIGNTFPLLETLAIDAPDRVDINRLRISIGDAPDLYAVPVSPFDPQIQLPWSQLTIFQSAKIDIPSCLKVLQNIPCLLLGYFGIQNDSSCRSKPMVQHTHGHLRQLILTSGDRRDAVEEDSVPMPFLRHLITPALEDLILSFSVSVCPETPPQNESTLLSFLSQPSTQLHSLRLSFMPTTTARLVECLQAAPSLRHFELTPTGHTADMDILFIQLTGQSDFLPHLESLHVDLEHWDDSDTFVTASIVVEMLCWRWDPPAGIEIAQLESFEIVKASKMRMLDSDPEVLRLREEGMVIVLE
ncbi:hypothetical protein B0H16DRAFT_1882739 [Mycena metata]|uniref:F-box domain-containing protein n=1 Tax=Mycena metata TaxID=1033252 RepID=A0AAD7JKD8_9AGAR|nr:hypothetical protein B0H16DRAFT_1882739 [Mycena metata]